MKKIISILLIVSVLVLMPISAIANTVTNQIPDKMEPPSTPISVHVKIPRLPALNSVVDVSIVVQSILDVPNTEVKLNLPDGISLVSGKSTWNVNLKENVPTTLSAKIKVIKNGNWEIEAAAKKIIDKDSSWGDIDVAYLNVNNAMTTSQFDTPKSGSLVLDNVPTGVKIISKDTIATESVTLDDLLNIDIQKDDENNQNIQGTTTLVGTFKYWTIPGDYRANTALYTTTVGKYFLIQVLNSYGTVLKSGYTNSAGSFSLSFTNPGSGGIRVRVYAYDKTSSGAILATTSNGVSIYYAQTVLFTVPDGYKNVGTLTLVKADPTEGAFWIKNDIEKAYRSIYLRNNPGSGIARWTPSSTDGTYYRLGEHIHLKGVDKKSSDTVIHEYGHNVMYNIYGRWFPINDCPSPHYINRIGGKNCGWTEGWADFFPLFVNGNPTYTWASGAYLNLETPKLGTYGWDNGDKVEGRVAGALWDIYDPINDGYDQITDGVGNIWYTIYHQKDDGHANDNTFYQYWTKLRTRYYSDAKAKAALKQNTIYY